MNRRRNGKIARLPEAARNQVNQMILDGVPYDQIIGWLADQGHAGILKMSQGKRI